MIIVISLILGGLVGWFRAGRRGGNRADKLQYAAVHAMIFAIISLFANLFLFGALV